MALHSIELCAGVGMLGEGARAAFEFLGHEHRTVCYVEREAAAAAQLVCLMEAGALDPAPVWSDLLTFDGAAWRGCVDLLIAGFPCQDISIAGRRAGLDGKRSGLFFNILDIADACGAWGLVLENVSAIATATATAVDEAEGALDERAAARVVGELADRGWDAEWITIPASDVGASHGRARWFCWAWRRVADAERTRWPQARCGPEVNAGNEPEPGRGALAHPSQPRLPHAQQREPGGARRWVEGGAAAELRAAPLFAPGPADHQWADILREAPWLAPALAPSNDEPNKKRLNPGFAEWLMGWPVGWTGDLDGQTTETSGSNFKGGNQKTGSAREISEWRKLLQVRIKVLAGPTPCRLHQAGGGIDSLPRVSSEGGCGGWDMESGGCGGNADLQDMQTTVSSQQEPSSGSLRGSCLLEREREVECRKAMENRTHRLRQIGNGVVPLQAAVALVELVRRAARH